MLAKQLKNHYEANFVWCAVITEDGIYSSDEKLYQAI